MCTFWCEMLWEEPNRQQIILFVGLWAVCCVSGSHRMAGMCLHWTVNTLNYFHTKMWKRTARKIFRSHCISALVLVVFENVSHLCILAELSFIFYMFAKLFLFFLVCLFQNERASSVVSHERSQFSIYIMSEWISAGKWSKCCRTTWVDVDIPTHTKLIVSTTFAYFSVYRLSSEQRITKKPVGKEWAAYSSQNVFRYTKRSVSASAECCHLFYGEVSQWMLHKTNNLRARIWSGDVCAGRMKYEFKASPHNCKHSG